MYDLIERQPNSEICYSGHFAFGSADQFILTTAHPGKVLEITAFTASLANGVGLDVNIPTLDLTVIGVALAVFATVVGRNDARGYTYVKYVFDPIPFRTTELIGPLTWTVSGLLAGDEVVMNMTGSLVPIVGSGGTLNTYATTESTV